MPEKAQRESVQIGSVVVDGFMLPDGTYVMSQTQAAECVGLSERNARDFLQSSAIKSLLGKGYTPAIFEAEPTSEQQRGSSRINGLPLEVVSAYWLWQAFRGNKAALPLCMGLITESLERRFDSAFGVSRSEYERNQRLSEQVEELERLMAGIATGLAMEDATRQENRYLWEVLNRNGIDPYALPEEEIP
jgi:hypothetical protein